MTDAYSDTQLEAYLDEALRVEQMAEIEAALRAGGPLVERLAQLGARRDAGVHSLGSIWRRQRASCPTRETLASRLLGALSDEAKAYVDFHIDTIGCRYCRANLEDLRCRQEEADAAVTARRRKYFESSAGYLRRR